ncbi:MAG: NAD(+)/NADH kinase [Phycisphaeraceae bacterium]
MATKSATRAARPRLLLLANHQKPQVNIALRTLRPWLEERAQVIAEIDSREMSAQRAEKLPKLDLAIVLGGDGTVLAQARALADRPVPLLGVNFGKVGFLAEFSADDLKEQWPLIAGGKCPSTRRMMLDVSVFGDSAAATGKRKHAPLHQFLAVNDAVITAGPPFRMIDLELILGPKTNLFTTRFTSDGVIVSTPSGTTANNLAAGGPIVSQQVDAVCITPLCPHSLSFRPIIARADQETRIRLNHANEGTTLVIDGQQSVRMSGGQEVRVSQSDRYLILMHNPSLSYWRLLAKKLRWAARPRRG